MSHVAPMVFLDAVRRSIRAETKAMERDRLAENLVRLERLLGSQSTDANGEETIHPPEFSDEITAKELADLSAHGFIPGHIVPDLLSMVQERRAEHWRKVHEKSLRRKGVIDLGAQVRSAFTKEILGVMAGIRDVFDDTPGHNRRISIIHNLIRVQWLAEDEQLFSECYRAALTKHLKRTARRMGKQVPQGYRLSSKTTVNKAVASMPKR